MQEQELVKLVMELEILEDQEEVEDGPLDLEEQVTHHQQVHRKEILEELQQVLLQFMVAEVEEEQELWDLMHQHH